MHIMKNLGEPFTQESVDKMISQADTNKDGIIDYTEFVHLIVSSETNPLASLHIAARFMLQNLIGIASKLAFVWIRSAGLGPQYGRAHSAATDFGARRGMDKSTDCRI
jgi:hypothetical protein